MLTKNFHIVFKTSFEKQDHDEGIESQSKQ